MFVSIANAADQTPSQMSVGFFDMVAQASPMVKLVLLLLMVLSVLTWAIIFSKWRTLQKAYINSEAFLDAFWSGKSLDAIYSEAKKYGLCPLARIFQSGYVELQRILEREKKENKDRNERKDLERALSPEFAVGNLERALVKAGRNESLHLERSLSFLATTGSAAPFIGLFGTVWGIMNAFHNIGIQGGASLAVVAPGIAEALVATAVGLGAAIPAVVGYNVFANKLRGLRTLMDNFSADFLNISRRNFLMG